MTTDYNQEDSGRAQLDNKEAGYQPPRPGCNCPADAPCRLSGRCTCNLTSLLNGDKIIGDSNGE